MKLSLIVCFCVLAGCSSLRGVQVETCETVGRALTAMFCPAIVEVSDGDAS